MLRQHAASGRAAAAAGLLDPTRLEVFNGLFMHVAEQMGVVLQQTASSVNIKERLDFSCAIFDAQAQLVANAPHMPVHLGSMGASVAAVVQAHGADLRPGDAYLVNSPYDGGTHLPDLTVVTPVFDDAGTLRFFAASRAHHADVGGMTPGSMPPGSRHIDEEGVLIPATRIVRDGRLDEPLLRRLLGAGACPARNPGQNLADLRAQLAANARGIRELERAALATGYDGLAADMRHVQDNAEALHAAGDPPARATASSATSSTTARRSRCVSASTASAARPSSISRGTSAQQANNFNAPRAVTVAAVLYVFRTLIDEPIPLNAGCLRPLSIVVPPGSMLDPRWPSAVVAGNVETSQCIVDALYGRSGPAGRVAGHDEQLHVRQRALPVLRDDRRRRRRRPGLRWRERRADAHDQLASHRSGSARKPLPGAAARIRAPRWVRRTRATSRRRRARAHASSSARR